MGGEELEEPRITKARGQLDPWTESAAEELGGGRLGQLGAEGERGAQGGAGFGQGPKRGQGRCDRGLTVCSAERRAGGLLPFARLDCYTLQRRMHRLAECVTRQCPHLPADRP